MTLDTTDDLLWQQLKTLPAFRALLRAVEARFYAYVELPEPLLDIGCGDGNFAQLALPGRRITAGIDPWWRPLNKAVKAGNYELPLQALGDNLPFADNYFASAFSNSVLGRPVGNGRLRHRALAILLLSQGPTHLGDRPRARLALGRAARPHRPLDRRPLGKQPGADRALGATVL